MATRIAIWAAGTRTYQPLVMRWNGTSWSQSILPALELSNYTLTKLAVLSPNDIWAVGYDNYSAIALHWDGMSWQNVSPPRSMRGDEDFRSVAALSSGNTWAAGTIIMGPGVSKTLVKQYAPAIELTDANIAHASGTATISDDTAIAGQDYTTTSGILTMPPYQTSAAFSVPLISNASWKPSATINIRLSNPHGALLGPRAALGLNVADTTKAPPGRVAFMPTLARSNGASSANRIVYVAISGTNTDIWVTNTNGGARHPLTSNPARDYDPAWSPDGRRLAFVSERDGNAEIYTMNADDSQQTRLTRDPQSDTSPAWSPDGRSIAFVSDRTRAGQAAGRFVYIMGADGSRQTRLTPPANGNPGDATPEWSPDGRQIAFVSQREGGSSIYVVNADGSQIRRVTPLSTAALNPAWIENGQRLAFFIPTFGYPNIVKINLDGSQMRLVNPNFDNAVPFSWSSDGTRIAFSDGYEITILLVAGGEAQVLSQSGQTIYDPVLAPQ